MKKVSGMKFVMIIATFLLSFNLFSFETLKGISEPWKPYMGDDLPNQGFLAEIVKNSLGRKQYPVEISFFPWARVIYNMKSGYADLVIGVYYTKEREDFLEYSDQIAVVEDVLFRMKGSNIDHKKLIDLKGYKIGVVKDAAHGEDFDSANYLNKISIPSIEKMIKMMIYGRIDLIAGPKDIINSIIKEQFPEYIDKFEQCGKPIGSNAVYIGFSRKAGDYEKRVKAFNEGLKEIKKDGTFDKLAEKHGFDFKDFQ